MKRQLLLVMLLVPLFAGIRPLPVLADASSRDVCSQAVQPGYARCLSKLLTQPNGIVPLATNSPQGYGPADFKIAYGDRGSGTMAVGIVVAYNAPDLLADLQTYSRQYGLPLPVACRSVSQTGCLAKVGQTSSALPVTNSSWSIETSLDTEMVHAMCPGCRLNVVEARSTSMDNLATAANYAASLGSQIVTNSYGGPESSGEAAYDRYYRHAGIVSVVSSGDSGYGVSYPASSPAVVAVGGTSLLVRSGRLASENTWVGAGSGCSLYEYKPSWQTDSRCAMRSVADVAADANPATGAAVYDSYQPTNKSGWYIVGGTSLAAPLVAGLVANSGQARDYPAAFYTKPSVLRDIVSGSNGSCSISYLCRAGPGYDGPTGLGVLSNL